MRQWTTTELTFIRAGIFPQGRTKNACYLFASRHGVAIRNRHKAYNRRNRKARNGEGERTR
jgi:hypothetical protein